MARQNYPEDYKFLLRHEKALRILVAEEKPLIYLGDEILVSSRWAENYNISPVGKKGVVTGVDLEPAIISRKTDNIFYVICGDGGVNFRAPYYSLDMLKRTESNIIIEKLLRENNRRLNNMIKNCVSSKK